MGVTRDTAPPFEITYLIADTGHVTHTADAAEVRRLVEWAGRHGVKVRVRPRDTRCRATAGQMKGEAP